VLIVLPLFILASLWALAKARPHSPFRFFADLYVNDWKLHHRVMLALPAYLAVPPMFGVFSSIKHGIGSFNSGLIDRALIDLDHALHGAHPWELLHPLLGFPAVTQALDFLYITWFFVIFGVMSLVTLWHERLELRNQYLVCFGLCWIVLGSFLAVLGASVGPCYLSTFMSEEAGAFEGLMAYLHAVGGLHAIAAQDLLLEHYSSYEPGIGRGISAMPSLHVAIAMLQAILGWKLGRWPGIIATVYLFAILLGSVHLGWHYAVDGYAAMMAVPLLWVVAGWIAGAATRRDPIIQPAE
jgi:hypothetical protein